MSFREDFLEKISGFSSERLRTEQRLLEQESDSLPEQISQLDEKLKSLEEEREKFWSERKPFSDEINTIQKNIKDREKILSQNYLSVFSNKANHGNFTLFFYVICLVAIWVGGGFLAIVFASQTSLGLFAVIILWLGLTGLLLNLNEKLFDFQIDNAGNKNREKEKKLTTFLNEDKDLIGLKKSKRPLEEKESEINAKERDFVKANIDPLKEERSTLDNRIQEISILLTEVLPDLLKTTRKKERNAKYKAVLGEQRNDAQTLKRYLLSETDENWICPYHNEKADRETAEADHIHPVSKGGQSTLQNMVLVCYDCNRGKGDSTLRNFCKVKGFIFEEVCERLESDGKEI